MRTQISNTNLQMAANATNIFDRIFSFGVPKPLAIPAMAAIVVLIGGVAFVQNNGQEGVFVASVRQGADTRGPDADGRGNSLRDSALSQRNSAVKDSAENFTVVFDEDSDKQESFKNALRNRIEAKIGRVKDLFAQLEDGDLAREISLNPRRYEENFKLADAELGKQIKSLLAEAEAALAEGDLIDALDLVNAIDKLLQAD